MSTLHGRIPAFARVCVSLSLWVAVTMIVGAMPDTTYHPRESVLFIGHLNFDCYPDTITGRPDAQRHYLPRTIRWGHGAVHYQFNALTNTIDTLYSDSACGGSALYSRRVATTSIIYPGWRNFTGTVAFQKMNADSVRDIIFYLWGKTGDSASLHDTSRAVLLFGQPGLDSLATIDVGTVASFQIEPFIAMEMRNGSEMVDPALRDLSGKVSYRLAPVAIDVAPGDEPALKRALPDGKANGNEGAIRGKLYPNPATVAARLELKSLPAGSYQVEVIGAGGSVVARQSATVPASGDLLRTLDVRSLPAGYYTVRVSRGEEAIGTYPIIITR